MVCLSDTFTIDFTIKLLKIPHFSYHIQIPLIQQSFSSYHDKRSEEHILSLDEIIQNSLMKCQLSHLSYFNFSLTRIYKFLMVILLPVVLISARVNTQMNNLLILNFLC